MMDVTGDIQAYVEAKRYLWNCHFRSRVKSLQASPVLDEFEEIDRFLFSALVLRKINEKLVVDAHKFGRQPFSFLSVIPETDRFSMMVNEKPNTFHGRWLPDQTFQTKGLKLLFVECFEWDRYGFVTFPYYLVQIGKMPETPKLEGRAALVLTTGLKVVYSGG